MNITLNNAQYRMLSFLELAEMSTAFCHKEVRMTFLMTLSRIVIECLPRGNFEKKSLFVIIGDANFFVFVKSYLSATQ